MWISYLYLHPYIIIMLYDCIGHRIRDLHDLILYITCVNSNFHHFISSAYIQMVKHRNVPVGYLISLSELPANYAA